MSWLAIVHQARGILYFSYSYTGPMRETHPQLWEETKTCARQIRELGAAVLTAPVDVLERESWAGRLDHQAVHHMGK